MSVPPLNFRLLWGSWVLFLPNPEHLADHVQSVLYKYLVSTYYVFIIFCLCLKYTQNLKNTLTHTTLGAPTDSFLSHISIAVNDTTFHGLQFLESFLLSNPHSTQPQILSLLPSKYILNWSVASSSSTPRWTESSISVICDSSVTLRLQATPWPELPGVTSTSPAPLLTCYPGPRLLPGPPQPSLP